MSHQQKLALHRNRIQFLIHLKSNHTQAQAGEKIGLKLRQRQHLWKLYRQGGLPGMLGATRKSSFGKRSRGQLSRLRSFLKTDQADTLRSLQQWLVTQAQGMDSLGGLRLLFKRLESKSKTGRPSHVRQDKEGLEVFKKTSPN